MTDNIRDLMKKQGEIAGAELFDRIFLPLFKEFEGYRIFLPLFKEFEGWQEIPQWRHDAAAEIAADETLAAMFRFRERDPHVPLAQLRAYRRAVQDTIKAKINSLPKR